MLYIYVKLVKQSAAFHTFHHIVLTWCNALYLHNSSCNLYNSIFAEAFPTEFIQLGQPEQQRPVLDNPGSPILISISTESGKEIIHIKKKCPHILNFR